MRFEALGDTKFTSIVNFPLGLDTNNLFTVRVGDQIVGTFQPGDTVDFLHAFGEGVSSFEILGIELLPELPDDAGVPFQLTFEEEMGSFRVREISASGSAAFTEPSLLLGLIAASGIGAICRRHKQR